VSQLSEKIRETCMPRGEFHVGNSNIAIGSLPPLQISRYTVIVALFEKIYHEFQFFPSSQISGRMFNTVVSVKCMMWKACRSPTLYADIGIQLLFANNRNRVRGAVLGLSQDGACTDLFENLTVNTWREIYCTVYRILPLSNHLFSHWSIPLSYTVVFLKRTC
jgi:hypothetical protein